MNKKLMSSVLAGAMAVSALSVSASAATATDKTVSAAGSTTFKVSATVAEAIIDVTIPSSMGAVVNPYGISVTTKTGVYGATGFTSPVYTIKNNTITSAVMVSATPTVTVPTTTVDKQKVPTIAVVSTAAEITAEDDKGKDAVKSIYAYVAGLEAATTVAAATAPTDLNVHDTAGTVDTNATVAVFEDATTDVKGALHTKTDLILIPKAEGTVTNGVTNVTKYGYGQIQMGGAVTNTNITPWTKSDKININLVLDIAPCADTATKGVYGNVVEEETPVDVPLAALSLTNVLSGNAEMITSFAANTTEYTVSAATAIGVTATADTTANADATVAISVVANGSSNIAYASPNVTNAAAGDKIIVTVTSAAAGKSTTYTITVE